jgi:hypothetical protein
MADNPNRPLLEDPVHEKEIFASEVANIGMIHGNFAITLANVRFDDAIGGQQPKVRRVVTGRIVLTNAAAGQLVQSIQQLAAQIEAAAKTAPSESKN